MKTADQIKTQIANKYNLGSTLVTGHMAKYWTEAMEEYANQFKPTPSNSRLGETIGEFNQRKRDEAYQIANGLRDELSQAKAEIDRLKSVVNEYAKVLDRALNTVNK